MKPRQAKGTPNPDGKSKSIAIHFETEIFDNIAAEAAKKRISFGQQVRIYIGRGIDASRKSP